MEQEIAEMKRVSMRVSGVKQAATLAVAAAAQELKAAGISVISFSTGEPDFPSPEVVKKAAIRAINDNFTHYTQLEGIPELRKVIADKFAADNNIHVKPSQVLVSSGGKHSIFNALAAIVDDGDEVLIPSPYWVSYPEMVRLVGGVPVLMKTTVEQRYKITPEQLQAAITPRTRAMIMNSPSNPTGVMYTPEEFASLGRILVSNGVFVISDELYEKMVYNGNTHYSIGALPELRDLAITVNGVSKAYAMTGWRIGYMCGPQDIMDAASRVQGQVTSNPTSISQMAALAALTEAGPAMESMVEAFGRRRNLAIELLSQIPDVHFPRPEGAFYLFADVSAYFTQELPDADTLSHYLLMEHHVAVVSGSAFGDSNAIRISYSCSEENIREGMARLARGLAALK